MASSDPYPVEAVEKARLAEATIWAVIHVGDVLVAGLSSGHLALWHVRLSAVSDATRAKLVAVGSAVYSLALMDGTHLACGCDQFLAAYEWRHLVAALSEPRAVNRSVPVQKIAVPAEANALAWDAAQKRLWVGAGEGVYAWRTNDGALETCGPGHRGSTLAIRWGLDGVLTSASEDGTVLRYDDKAQKVVSTFTAPFPDAYCAAVQETTSSGKTIVTVAGGVEPRHNFVAKSSGFVATFDSSSGQCTASQKLDDGGPCRDVAGPYLATDSGVFGRRDDDDGSYAPLSIPNLRVTSPAVIALLDDDVARRWGLSSSSSSEEEESLDRRAFIVAGAPPVVDLCTRSRCHRSLRVL
mmetsp:Transcript_4449/g.13923  ORF Transcript_4449/g.13923 Transcript_4449/m.13923 type:complete len:354 (+) Transcript_4449:108-1169(+)